MRLSSQNAKAEHSHGAENLFKELALNHVCYEKRGRVAYVTMNRPDKLNAMDSLMHTELSGVWNDFECDDQVWLAVLTGQGNRAFSVGQDLAELVSIQDKGGIDRTFGSKGEAGWPRLTERFELTKPVIARVDGYALGGGFELALACDIIIASGAAEFGLPEARLGLIAGAGGVFRLIRQIPSKIAMGYLMTGQRISAARAYELGLVNEVVQRAELDACVNKWVQSILECAPLSVRAIKEVSVTSQTLPLHEAFAITYSAEERRRKSNDAREGPLAFIEKRKPQWKGN